MSETNERRASDAYIDALQAHTAWEEKQRKEDAQRMSAIEQDLQPLKKMYWAVVGSGGAVVMMIGLLLFIYNNDRSEAKELRADTKELQQAIVKQGTAIEKLLMSHSELERDYRRDMTRVEAQIEKIHGRHK